MIANNHVSDPSLCGCFRRNNSFLSPKRPSYSMSPKRSFLKKIVAQKYVAKTSVHPLHDHSRAVNKTGILITATDCIRQYNNSVYENNDTAVCFGFVCPVSIFLCHSWRHLCYLLCLGTQSYSAAAGPSHHSSLVRGRYHRQHTVSLCLDAEAHVVQQLVSCLPGQHLHR